MRRRDFLVTCATLAAAPRAFAFQSRPSAAPVAPANAWPQFRGSYALTGISSTTIGPAPKLAWTWEGGEAFDSSPAIVDDVVYVGTATGVSVPGMQHAFPLFAYSEAPGIWQSLPPLWQTKLLH